MKFFSLCAATLPLVSASLLTAQRPLEANRVKVPGENPAHHCSADPEDDLFFVQNLTIMPEPIET
jgi:hypothetical protein